jgi:hypothetical protein
MYWQLGGISGIIMASKVSIVAEFDIKGKFQFAEGLAILA